MPGSEIDPPAPAYSSLSMLQSIGICAISEFGDLGKLWSPWAGAARSASRWAYPTRYRALLLPSWCSEFEF